MTTTLVEPFFSEVNSYIGLRDAIRPARLDARYQPHNC